MSGKELVCIACPMACRLVVSHPAGGEIAVSGNRCARGEAYGREEMLAPRRIVTAVVPTESPDFPCAPVRSEGTVPREAIPELLRLIPDPPVPAAEGKRQRYDRLSGYILEYFF